MKAGMQLLSLDPSAPPFKSTSWHLVWDEGDLGGRVGVLEGEGGVGTHSAGLLIHCSRQQAEGRAGAVRWMLRSAGRGTHRRGCPLPRAPASSSC